MTKFDYSQKPWWAFAYEATMEALEDAKMKISEIEAIVFTGMSSAAGVSIRLIRSLFFPIYLKPMFPLLKRLRFAPVAEWLSG